MLSLLVLLLNITMGLSSVTKPVTASIELQVPLTPLTSYDCQTDGHSIMIREASIDGIPLTEGNTILDYHVPEGVVWKDIKYRTNMGSLFITIPIMYPHFYTVQNIDERGVLV